jgi:(1->4)-alpha-D-glucan 1-alpha-D-glucosylmutase
MAAEVLCATYRVQLHAGFGLTEAAALADYLAQLGVSHLYCSPYLQAAPGSTHGYDVVNPHQVNAELGGAVAHTRLCHVLEEHRLGHVLDIVPNHMAIGGQENPWWWDVLENGPSSRYAAYFDVDWDPPEVKLRNTVLLPVLGDHYGRVLEAGELQLTRVEASFIVQYHAHTFPVSPRSLNDLLGEAAERCHSDDLAFLAAALGRLPLATATDQVAIRQRHRDKEVIREHLARLCHAQPAVAATLDATVAEVNADPDALDALLERQNYRLAFWRTAGRELGYRRFFDINTLVGLRTEDERVFADTHKLILDWLAPGILHGVRIDHPDGLRDPEEYFRRCYAACPHAWIVAEKILAPGERLPASWPIAGTTGYDFITRVSNLFVAPTGAGPLTQLYADFTGAPTDFAAVAWEKKHLIMREVLGSDVNRLTALFVEVCERHRRHRDYTRHELHEVLREVIACFPVYRTYVRAEVGQVSTEDVRYITEAIEAAKMHRPDLDRDLFDFFRDLLVLRVRGDVEAELVMRFQQLTGPVMAKGVEDTAFYCFNRLVSLNEVGGDPGQFGLPVDAFHRACAETQARWPQTLLTTSTHDTKRSEDVRARIHLLSEIPEGWGAAVWRWAALNERYRTAGMPDRNAEYLWYQTLVGAWPIEVERAVAYMEKTSREAKVSTSWTDPNPAYDAALRAFVEGTLRDAAFRADVEAFVAPLIGPGRVVSLAQTLLKLTTPGVPDLYQGTELWTCSLVDPDNRRPVDYALRSQLLAELDRIPPAEVWDRMEEGLPKVWVMRQALALRRRRPHLFGPQGAYRALTARGATAAHVVAFARGEGVVTVVPRLVLGLGGRWGDTTLALPVGRWHNELTGDTVDGGEVCLVELLGRAPIALLSKEGDGV